MAVWQIMRFSENQSLCAYNRTPFVEILYLVSSIYAISLTTSGSHNPPVVREMTYMPDTWYNIFVCSDDYYYCWNRTKNDVLDLLEKTVDFWEDCCKLLILYSICWVHMTVTPLDSSTVHTHLSKLIYEPDPKVFKAIFLIYWEMTKDLRKMTIAWYPQTFEDIYIYIYIYNILFPFLSLI